MIRKVFLCLSCGHNDVVVNGKTEHHYEYFKDANTERDDVRQHLEDNPDHFIAEVLTGNG